MQVLSFNELGMDSLMKPKKQVVIMVVSSTGEGDPPDNSARFYGHSKYAFGLIRSYHFAGCPKCHCHCCSSRDMQ